MRTTSFCLLLLLFYSSCKKDIGCGPNEINANGVCICDEDHVGEHCDTLSPTFGVAGNYICNVGASYWDGSHTRDTSYSYLDTLIVERIGADTIKVGGFRYGIPNLGYNEDVSDPVVMFNEHQWQGNYVEYNIAFYKNTPDSISGRFYIGGWAGGTHYQLKGSRM